MSRQQPYKYNSRRPRGGAKHNNWRRRPDDNDDDRLVIKPFKAPPRGGMQGLKPPRLLGSFSVDGDKNVLFNNSTMPILSSKYIPDGNKCLKVDLDLNKGRRRIKYFSTTPIESFRYLLRWILRNQKLLKANGSSDRLTVDMICSRAALRSVMQAPYARYHSWKMTILAQYFKGSIYMTFGTDEEYDSQKQKESTGLISVFGHKFEQYMTGGDPDDPLECNIQFRCVLNLHFKELSLLYGIATDAVDMTLHQPDMKDMAAFVRLKVVKEKVDQFQRTNFKKYDLNRWWSEIQLSGTPRVLMGTRTHAGTLHTLQMLKIADVLSMSEGEWDPSVSINFLDKFLSFVKQKVISDPNRIHQFERSASDFDYFHHRCDTSVEEILPPWYKERLFTEDYDSDYSEVA